MTDPRVIVVGGGLAGIAAALRCAGSGAEVTLLESRGRLGGAAYSFGRDGLTADNGQHVFLRCCRDYQQLVHELDADDLVTMQSRLEIEVLAPGGRRGRLSRSALPAPLHLAAALARYPFLGIRQRLAVTAAMAALRFVDPDDAAADRTSFADWLRRHGQDQRCIEAIWDLIVRPTINLTSEQASLAQAALVFRLGLLERRAAGDIGHAAVPLSQIHDVAGRAALARAGVDVRLRATARAIVACDGGFELTLADDAVLRAGQVIVCTPPPGAAALVPDGAGVDRSAWQRLGGSPIVNLHVVYDRQVLSEPFAAAIDSPVQWVFDRTASAGLADGGQYLVVTLSAAEDELGESGERLRDRFLPALAELLPAARAATVRRWFVTRDHAATFRAAPGQRALRPGPVTALPGLYLAGAWTDTGWPATMEGAVRSGRAAAALALARMGSDAVASERAVARDTVAGPHRQSSPAPLTVLAPMRLEAAAIRHGAPWATVARSGIGPRAAGRYARSHDHDDAAAVMIAGLCGAVDPSLRPGDVVLASELRGPRESDSFHCADPSILAGVLRRGGLRTRVGPIASARGLVTGARRRALARTGALAADTESAWLAPAAGARPLYALRVVLDTPGRELRNPVASAAGTATALRSLRRAAALLSQWAPMLGDRELLLGPPSQDTSHAGQNRQTAVRTLAQSCDLMIVVGSENSSDSRRLVDAAHRGGCRSLLVSDASQLTAAALAGTRRIGITAGPLVPDELVNRLIDALRGLGAATVDEQTVAEENLHLKLPPAVMQRTDH